MRARGFGANVYQWNDSNRPKLKHIDLCKLSGASEFAVLRNFFEFSLVDWKLATSSLTERAFSGNFLDKHIFPTKYPRRNV